MKIIDSFIFYNELDLLHYRLQLLNDHVDSFILVEAKQTFAGNPKELYFEKNKHLFESFLSKIIHIVIDLPYQYPNIDYSKNQQWQNEYYQRNVIKEGIKNLNLSNNDLVIISDLDEIVDPNILISLKKGDLKMDMEKKGFTLIQDFYYYHLGCKSIKPWIRTKIVHYSLIQECSVDEIRMKPDDYFFKIERGGWHLSYFGDSCFIQNKIKEFSHQEYNDSLHTSSSYIEEKIKKCESLFVHSKEFEYITIQENSYLPPMYDIYLRNYYKKNNNIPKYIYFHICCIGDWYKIVEKILFKIKNSGLYHEIQEIRCSILGDYRHYQHLFQDPKIKIISHSYDIQLLEKHTINQLYHDATQSKDEFYVLYLNTTEVHHDPSSQISKYIYDWVEYMCYFNIYQYETCLQLLGYSNGVGLNLQENNKENIPYHYSGNFWWSKASNIRKLDRIVDTYYNSPEFWITRNEGPYISLWNSNKHHFKESYPSSIYQNKKIIFHIVQKEKEPRHIAFYENQLCERGSSTNTFDYAYFNQLILKNKSFIFYDIHNKNNHPIVIQKFQKYFEHVIGLSSYNEIDFYIKKLKIPTLYQIKGGWNDFKLSSIAKNCIHSIFTCHDPFGDIFVSRSNITNQYNSSIPIVSPIIYLPIHDLNMRVKLKIPLDAIVFGGYGGKDCFNIPYVHQVIYQVAKENPHIYFLFANFDTFCETLPNIIHLPTIIDMDEKVEFIQTCDAMIWAKKDGETFGNAIGEFSSKNKPIIATKVGMQYNILRSSALWYNDMHSLQLILLNFKKEDYQIKDVDAYRNYTPEKVMKKFEEVFLS